MFTAVPCSAEAEVDDIDRPPPNPRRPPKPRPPRPPGGPPGRPPGGPPGIRGPPGGGPPGIRGLGPPGGGAIISWLLIDGGGPPGGSMARSSGGETCRVRSIKPPSSNDVTTSMQPEPRGRSRRSAGLAARPPTRSTEKGAGVHTRTNAEGTHGYEVALPTPFTRYLRPQEFRMFSLAKNETARSEEKRRSRSLRAPCSYAKTHQTRGRPFANESCPRSVSMSHADRIDPKGTRSWIKTAAVGTRTAAPRQRRMLLGAPGAAERLP
jgi:hypothetical protein